MSPIGDIKVGNKIVHVTDWRHETTSSFRLERFSGGHFYLVDHWKAIAALVGEAFSLGTGVRSAA